MTRAGHKRKGHNEEQSEMMEENFQPPRGAVCAVQSARCLLYAGVRTLHANKFLKKDSND